MTLQARQKSQVGNQHISCLPENYEHERHSEPDFDNMSYLLRRIIRNPYMFMAKALWSIEGAIFSKFVNNSFCLVVIINTGRSYSSLASICSRSFVLGLSSICHLSKYHYNILMPPPPPSPILYNHCFQFVLGRFLKWRIAIQFCEAL